MSVTSRTHHQALTAPRVQEGGGIQSIGFFFLCVFLFLGYSRLADSLLSNLYLPLMTSTLALVVTIFGGGVPRALFSRTGIWLSLFSLWLLLAVPFSYWQGGSLQFLWDQWLKSFLVFVIVAGLIRTVRQSQVAMYSIAAATITVLLMCLFIGGSSTEGRLVLEQGVLANPNDLAGLLIIGTPFLLLMAMRKGPVPLTRPIAAISIVGALVATGATGSRGALIAFACLTFVMFLNLSWSGKVKLLGAVALVLPLVVFYLSAEQRDRYLTIFGGQSEQVDANDAAALGSTSQRIYLLRQSIDLSFTHPLFGVGPGVFAVASAADTEREGQTAAWRETHNAYTQVSSEAGLPALVFYLAALMSCFTVTRSTYKTALARGLVDTANTSYCLWLSLIAFAVTACFSSVAYHLYFPTLAGLSVALSHSTRAELTAAPARAK
ncbi:MAG TPA: O-antigen ligase family protein [Vicinamibacterales bacterium]|nr:O-antigen ligase family protein [Vicinamibacterales bacterium]